MKVDLSVAPHFYSPRDRKNTPPLSKIVDILSKKDLDLVALTSCHTRTSGIDFRWRDYLAQELSSQWKREENSQKGELHLVNQDTGREFRIIHTQKVRAYEDENPAYLLVFGLGEIINPGRNITETALEVKERGGFALIPDPNTASATSFVEAMELYKMGLVQSIQISATNQRGYTEKMTKELAKAGIRAFPSSNAKRVQDAGTSYAELELDKELLLMSSLAKVIRANNFRSHYGQMSRWQTFMSRDRYIYASIPDHLIAGGERREEFLRAIGLKKKKQ